MFHLIIDCYTDEPSGLWVPPFLWTYQRYLSQALNSKWIENKYITVDDLRYYKNWNKTDTENPKKTTNLTKNKDIVSSLIDWAEEIHIVWWCFISYNYFSCFPPTNDELLDLIKDTDKNKITLFYELGINRVLPKDFVAQVSGSINKLVIGNPYNYILNGVQDNFESNYKNLKTISHVECSILEQLDRPYIIELESWSGCNHAKCTFCIEAMRKTKVVYRDVEDILKEVRSLHNQWARNFRIGKQPNFYNFQAQNVYEFEKLLGGIRETWDIEMLHIDNVNPEDVVSNEGIEITKLLAKYSTSWNIANFWVESFDPLVRFTNKLNWTVDQIMRAMEVINEYGAFQDPDGLYRLLPGVNILYWLSFHRAETLAYNLEKFEEILSKGLLSRRTFIRRITSPFGFSFGLIGKWSKSDEDFFEFEKQITDKFIMPMQEKVYKTWSIITKLEEVYFDGQDSMLRKLWTCAERFIIKGKKLESGNKYNIKISGHVSARVMTGEIIE